MAQLAAATPGAAGHRLRAWQLYLAAGAALVVAYYLIPLHGAGRAIRVVAYCSTSASASLAVFVGIRRFRPRRLRPWVLLGLGQAVYACADITFYSAHYLFHSSTYPGPADLLYLAHYPLVVAALAFFVRDRTAGRDVPGLVDAAMLALAAALLSWLYLIRPQSGTGLALAASVLYPVMDLAVAAVACTLVLRRGRRSPSFFLLVGSLLMILATDTVYVLQQLDGSYRTGNFLDAMWLSGNLLLGATGLHPSMARLADPTPPAYGRRVGWVRLSALSAAALVAPTVLLVMDLQGRLRDVAVIAVVSGVMFLLAIIRMGALIADQRRIASTDDLTGLRTRRYLEAQLPLEMARARRTDSVLAMLIVDVDHFKSVNDRYGHPAGDRVLTEVASRLGTATLDGEVLARYGGEEFALLAPGVTEEGLQSVAERLRHGVSATPVALSGDEEISVTVSVGASNYPVHADDQAQLVAVADRALYAAKEEGRDRSVIGRGHVAAGLRSAGGRRLSPEYLFSVADTIDSRLSSDEHGRAVGRWAGQLAVELGLERGTVSDAELAGRLHDIGKIVVPEGILRKPGPLDDEEWRQMREHAAFGERLALPIPGFGAVAQIIRQHHERWDGGGYPDGLAGDGIRVEARVVAVCDAWAAMRADRPYQRAVPVEQARERLAAGSRSAFDAQMVECFLALQRRGVLGDLRQGVPPAGQHPRRPRAGAGV